MKGKKTMKNIDLKPSNYKIFLDTINSLRYSQGFYSRLARDVEEMGTEEKDHLKNYLNGLPAFKDSLDVVLFLEA